MNISAATAERMVGGYREPTVRSPVFFVMLLLLVLVSFETFLAEILGVPLLASSSHAAIAPVFFILLMDLSKGVVRRPYMELLSVFLVLVVISMVSSYYRGFAVTALAVGLYIKLFFLAAVFSRVTLDELDKAIGAYAVLHIGGGVANILAPGFFLDLVGAVASSADRFMGLQLNPNSFAFASALLTIYYIYVRRNMFAAVFLGITVVASGSRSGLAFLALAILYFAYLQGRIKGQVLRKAIVAAAIIGAAFVSALFFFPDQFLRSLDSAIATADGFGFYPRVALLIGGIQLAVANFPLGAGAGTYASALAGFSQTYRDVGVDYLPSILDESAIHDSGVGTLLGEYGVAGTLAILVFCYRLALIFGRGYITRVDGLFFVFLVIFFSLFRATISSYYYSGILIVFLMMVYAVRSRAGR